ncbi:MAG: carboxymuconolactone decarboxylase family protein [Candidatus Binataceae bacterium]
MAHVKSLSRNEAKEIEPLIEPIEAATGFLPNSLLTIARPPEILRAFAALAGAVRKGTVSPELKQLVAYMSSTAAGCRYCQAHTADSAARIGVPLAKLEASWSFESDNRFDKGDRAALRLARDASAVPNAVIKPHFEDLHKYFSDDEIVSLVAVISLFGWLNRCNDTMATELESEPLNFALRHLAFREVIDR